MYRRKGIGLTRRRNRPNVEWPKEVGDLYDVAGRFADLSGGRDRRPLSQVVSVKGGSIVIGWRLDTQCCDQRASTEAQVSQVRKKGGNKWILGKPHR